MERFLKDSMMILVHESFKTHISGLEGFKKCRAKGAVSKIQNTISDRKKVIKQQGCKYVNQPTYFLD